MKRLATFILFIIVGAATAYAAPLTEQQKIDALLDRFASQHVTIVRNSKTHDGAWAKKHFQEKLADMKGQVPTAQDFIDKVATKSRKTGQPYQIKTADGKMMNSADWLKLQLADIEKSGK